LERYSQLEYTTLVTSDIHTTSTFAAIGTDYKNNFLITVQFHTNLNPEQRSETERTAELQGAEMRCLEPSVGTVLRGWGWTGSDVTEWCQSLHSKRNIWGTLHL